MAKLDRTLRRKSLQTQSSVSKLLRDGWPLRCSIRRAFDLGKALHVAPDFTGREQGAIDNRPARPVLIRDLPFGRSDLGRLLLFRALDGSIAIIAGSKNAIENFRVRHSTCPLDWRLSRFDAASRGAGSQATPTQGSVTAGQLKF